MYKFKDVLIFILIFYILLFIFNLIIQLQSNEYISKRIEKISKANLDRRHPFLVLRDLNLKIETIPAQHPEIYLYREKDYIKDFFPLSGFANINTLMCNENGYWKTYYSDMYGFNNDNNKFFNKSKNENNIMIIGDSTSEGYCVNDKYLLNNFLENEGYNVFNFAKGGNGPLIEYATLREYIDLANFNTIIWAYYPNDLRDLDKEYEDKVLIKYLNDEKFFQNIISKQDLVDEFYVNNSDAYNQYFNFINEPDEAKLAQKFEEISKKDFFLEKLNLSKHKFIDLFTLKALFYDINSRINFLKLKFNQQKSYEKFFRVINKANELIKNKNAKMLFIYLPSRIEILNKSPADKKIIQFIKENKIEYLDLNSKISGKYNYEDVYNFGLDDVHYNEEIYKLISMEILEYFKK